MDPLVIRDKLNKIMRGYRKDTPIHIAIVFTDGERHITPFETIDLGLQAIRYTDVHCERDAFKIGVEYRYIADVCDFADLESPVRVPDPDHRVIDANFTVLSS